MDSLLLDVSSEEPSDSITLAHYAERAYLDYAVSVVKGRALPDVCDGQKPVQRRILFAMTEMGLGPGAKPMKSARVVGDVLGKFHPHGDQAAYEALVRMAQGFTLRYPLIDGQGNFGSRDGDGAAAMRYTEARLTPVASLLLDEIDMGTVDFMPTYDGTLREPKLLPARLPFVLLNGASGIAVGMATEIPPHNLREVAQAVVTLIAKPDTSLDEVMALIPGPDFPGGAQIISSPEAIREVYATGRGSVKVRARWTIEEMARGQWQLVINELPPNTSSAKVLEEIEELTNPKVKPGKKSLSPDQQTMKQTLLGVLDAVRDESGKAAAVRLVFEPKSRNIDVNEFVTLLLAHTSLETNTSINLVSIARDGRPGQRGLLAMLLDWIEFRAITIRRRSQHRLLQVEDRLHVLEGRLIAWLNIDEVIATIREADEPKSALMARFSLSERQAEDILEIRLRQLARLEKIKIEQEMAGLRTEKEDLQALLADEGKLRRRMVSEIRKDAEKFGDDRRTVIEMAQKAQVEVKVIDEPVTVIVSSRFWLRARQGHGLDPQTFNFKSGDALGSTHECRTTDSLAAFGSGTAQNRVFSIPVSALPGGRGDGAPLQSFIELMPAGQIACVLAQPPERQLLLAGTGGYGFVCKFGDLQTRQKAGKSFLSLDEAERLLPPVPLSAEHSHCAVLSDKGRFHVFPLAEMKTLSGGGRGVQCLPLKEGEQLLGVLPIATGDALEVYGTGRAGKTQILLIKAQDLQSRIGKRGGKGRELDVKFKIEGFRRASALI
ncbi:MAG: DNA topoisomerase IV subunit A [Burkholderiales bacterium]|nr:DNA topoisomerase IV subunit A [Burkholderiales bacterium]